MSTTDTNLQQLVINVGTTAQIEAAIQGGTITSDMLSITTDGDDYATQTWVGNQGYITGITSSDVTTALGYTPYDSSNPNGYTSNVGTVTSVNNTSPDGNGNVTLSIPAAQVNSDWNANSGVAEILNKPTLGTMAAESASDYTPTASLAAVATSGAYSDLSGTPTIPTVNNATLTVTQNGTSVGTFTANASSDVTIAVTDTTYSAFGGATGSVAGTAGLVPAPLATDNVKYLKGDGSFAQVAYSEISGTPTIPTVDQSYSASSANAQSGVAIAGAGFLNNIATGNNSLTILGTASTNTYNTNVGYSARATNSYCAAFGYDARGTGYMSTALGARAYASANYAIQIGYGTNSTASTLAVGFNNTNYELLDGTTGLIPVARLNAFTGADGTNAGTKGAVPAPLATDNTKFLKGDGTWDAPTATINWGTSTSNVSSTRPAVVVKTYVNGKSWYRVYSDKWCEQGGWVSVDGVTGNYNVNFSKTFSDTNYTPMTCVVRADANYIPVAVPITRNAASMTVACGSYTGSFYWTACGYVSSI